MEMMVEVPKGVVPARGLEGVAGRRHRQQRLFKRSC